MTVLVFCDDGYVRHARTSVVGRDLC
jgi:hypothetical protein